MMVMMVVVGIYFFVGGVDNFSCFVYVLFLFFVGYSVNIFGLYYIIGVIVLGVMFVGNYCS